MEEKKDILHRIMNERIKAAFKSFLDVLESEGVELFISKEDDRSEVIEDCQIEEITEDHVLLDETFEPVSNFSKEEFETLEILRTVKKGAIFITF